MSFYNTRKSPELNKTKKLIEQWYKHKDHDILTTDWGKLRDYIIAGSIDTQLEYQGSLVGKSGRIKNTVIPEKIPEKITEKIPEKITAELAVNEDDIVRVVNATSAHWWRVRDNSGNEGYVSPNNLELLD